MKFTVAIDGPAAAGKGTISRAVAEIFGFAYLDTGLLYRAVGVVAKETGLDPIEVAKGLARADLERDDLRSAAAAQEASKVAVIPEVRTVLLSFQKEFARRDGGAVLDGRDIGTVICPDADVKLFVTASAEVRAQRRFAELLENGADTSFDAVLADVKGRDERDAARDVAPMRPAADAVLLDTSELSIDDALARVLTIIRNKQIKPF